MSADIHERKDMKNKDFMIIIKKIRHSDEDLSVDFLYLNNHVNNNTIESTKKIISKHQKHQHQQKQQQQQQQQHK